MDGGGLTTTMQPRLWVPAPRGRAIRKGNWQKEREEKTSRRKKG
jgi:hypothetical protein